MEKAIKGFNDRNLSLAQSLPFFQMGILSFSRFYLLVKRISMWKSSFKDGDEEPLGVSHMIV